MICRNVDLKKRRAKMPGCGTRNRMMLVAVLAALLAGAVSEVDMGDDIGDDVVGDEIVGGGDEIVGEKKVGGGEAQGLTRNKGPKQEDMMILYAAAGFFLLLALAIGKWASSQGHDAAKPEAGGRQGQGDVAQVAGGAARRTALARMRARRQTGGGDNSDDDEEEDVGGKKLGKKKLAKLDKKEESRAMREAMEEEKAKRREKQEKEEEEAAERRQTEIEKERAEAEAEAKRIADAKKKEEEEFDKWKDMFETGEDGAQADDDLQETQGLLQEFIDYLKAKKISPLDEVAAEFKLKSQEVVNRVEGLEAMGTYTHKQHAHARTHTHTKFLID